MSRPVIALLSDFGSRDYYVGAMKGVILGICPEATLVDITHNIEPYDVRGAARALADVHRYFPDGTIFLGIVDPGVGSDRRALAAEVGTYRFVAPDNGILSLVLGDPPDGCVVELTEQRYARPVVSRTFEGRDRFAPAAAWLATGVALRALGRPAGDTHRLAVSRACIVDGAVAGEVVRVDRFGNLVTNIDRVLVEQLSGRRRVQVRAGGAATIRVVGTYADAPPGEMCALFGSTDCLEVATNGGSAAARLELSVGASVSVVVC